MQASRLINRSLKKSRREHNQELRASKMREQGQLTAEELTRPSVPKMVRHTIKPRAKVWTGDFKRKHPLPEPPKYSSADPLAQMEHLDIDLSCMRIDPRKMGNYSENYLQ